MLNEWNLWWYDLSSNPHRRSSILEYAIPVRLTSMRGTPTNSPLRFAADLHVMRGDWPLNCKLPCIGGHEGAGYVVAISDNTQTDLQIGSRVGIKWLAYSCGACELCRKGLESSCEKAECSGFSVDGTFQQYCVSFAAHVTPIPDSLSLKMAAPIMCAGVTVVCISFSHSQFPSMCLTCRWVDDSGSQSRQRNSPQARPL